MLNSKWDISAHQHNYMYIWNTTQLPSARMPAVLAFLTTLHTTPSRSFQVVPEQSSSVWQKRSAFFLSVAYLIMLMGFATTRNVVFWQPGFWLYEKIGRKFYLLQRLGVESFHTGTIRLSSRLRTWPRCFLTGAAESLCVKKLWLGLENFSCASRRLFLRRTRAPFSGRRFFHLRRSRATRLKKLGAKLLFCYKPFRKVFCKRPFAWY